MNLAIDIGNTRIKAGFFDGAELVAQGSWPHDDPEGLFGLLANHPVRNAIFSTVGHRLPSRVEGTLADKGARVWELTHHTPLPIRNRYATPHTLGKDRLAAAVGAHALHPGQAALLIDAGTCITYDLLTASGDFLGGNIAPGLRLRLRAMHTFTGRLPLVEAALPAKPWGDDTETALQNGALRGALHEMEGFVAQARTENPQLTVILTGGDADFFAENAKSRIFVHRNLVLIGLNKILSHNVELQT